MVVGAAAVAIALISLGWTKEIVGLFFSPGEVVRPQSCRSCQSFAWGGTNK